MDVGSISSGSNSVHDTSSSSRRNRPGGRSKRRKGKLIHQRFSDYIVFGLNGTICLLAFVVCYGLLLLTLWPLLTARAPSESFVVHDETPRDYLNNMHLPPALHDAHLPGQDKLVAASTGLRKRLQQFRQGRGVTDSNLLDQAKAEFDEIQKKRNTEDLAKADAARQQQAEDEDVQDVVLAGGGGQAAGDHGHDGDADGNGDADGGNNNINGGRLGFVVLGMHRSGTSMLSGLLTLGNGYQVGGPLIGAAFDNEKGFFERVDVVLQNDEFMAKQNINWAANVINYDPEKALEDKKSGVVTFQKGKTGLAFMNNPANAPWLQKDPRMCITLKTWLRLFRTEPAVVFSYRNPLEVAMSLKKREKNFTLERGLRLWIVYNMRAIQNSHGLCVIHTSNDAILKDPLYEIQRISDELTATCDLPEPPETISQDVVDKFIDPALQHNRKEREEEEKEVIETFNNGECKVYTYISDHDEGTPSYEREHDLYRKAMKIYCDFQSEEAYKDGYEWPELK